MPSEILRGVVFMGLLGVALAFELDRERLAEMVRRYDADNPRMSVDQQKKVAHLARLFFASYLGAVASICGALYITWTIGTTP